MSAWQEVVAAALVGTERNAALPAAPGALGDLLSRLDAAEPERRLCQALAALGSWQRAGRLPARDPQPLPEPSAPDPLPPCSPAAAHHLATMIAGTHHGALPEWLRAAAARGLRVPDALLPEVLEVGRKRADWRSLVASVTGARGRWLALQNPDWEFLARQEATLEALWQTGERDARRTAFLRLRQEDPARARALLEESWATEQPEERAAFVDVMADGLSMEDEPFLEARLDDRRKEVRQAAARLLAQLPESRLSRRMLERLRPLIRLRRRLIGFVLEVSPPENGDHSMTRDGIDGSLKGRSAGGERASWLAEMLAAVPPSHWSQELEKPPSELLAAARGSDWQQAILIGWSRAAVTHGDAAWAEALLRERLREPDRLRQIGGWSELAGVLPPDGADSLFSNRLREHAGSLRDNPALLPLLWYHRALGASLSRSLLELLRRAAGDGHPPDILLRNLLGEAALRMDAGVATDAGLGWPTGAAAWNAWEGPVSEFIATLTFRRDMLKELSS